MAQLIIDNKTIDTSIYNILLAIRKEAPGFLDRIKQGTNNILCTCPFHANHKERHVSCGITVDPESEFFGTFHCFACKETGNLDKFVSQCFNCSILEAKQWLIDNFADGLIDYQLNLPEIELKPKIKNNFIDESILNTFEDFHPYLEKRKISRDIAELFKVKFDASNETIVFPFYNSVKKLTGFTRRSINHKTFYIDPNIDKKNNLYLYYYIKEKVIDTCAIVEGQIDALTCHTYGLPAVATIGGITENQIDLINKSGIRFLYTIFDNDEYGRKFTEILNKYLSKSIIAINVKLPDGYKDVNELDNKAQFWDCIIKAKERF